MTDINQRVVDLENQLKLLQLQYDQLHDVQEATNIVLAWLLSKHPRDEAVGFLSSQANELEGDTKYDEDVALLDYLRDLLALFDASHAKNQ